MKIAVVGNRKGWTYDQVMNHLNRERVYRKADLIISGGADGVDWYAQIYAKSYSIPILIYYPFNDLPVPERYYNRNKKIAEECDLLIAFDKESFSGTSNTVRYAKELNKEIVIINKLV